MRDIKFRAWDKRHYKFLYKFFYDRNWYNKDDKCVRGLMPECQHHQILEEYTGLKDKNGEEIYEGDILEYYLYHPPMDNLGKYESNDRHKGQVIFNNGQFKIDASCKDNVILFRFDLAYLTIGEIIGNIHETTEGIK